MRYGLFLLFFIPTSLCAQKTGSKPQSKETASVRTIDSLKAELKWLNQKREAAWSERAPLRTQLEDAYNALQIKFDEAKLIKDTVDNLDKKSYSKEEKKRIQQRFDDLLSNLEKLTAEANKSEELLSKKNAEIKKLDEKIADIKKQIQLAESK